MRRGALSWRVRLQHLRQKPRAQASSVAAAAAAAAACTAAAANDAGAAVSSAAAAAAAVMVGLLLLLLLLLLLRDECDALEARVRPHLSRGTQGLGVKGDGGSGLVRPERGQGAGPPHRRYEREQRQRLFGVGNRVEQAEGQVL